MFMYVHVFIYIYMHMCVCGSWLVGWLICSVYYKYRFCLQTVKSQKSSVKCQKQFYFKQFILA